MIPSPWVAVILTLGTFRILRLLSYDTFPPIFKARIWFLSKWPERWIESISELWTCVFCLGFWLSLAVYLLWLWLPTETLYIAAPFALSGAAGLIAKNLDP